MHQRPGATTDHDDVLLTKVASGLTPDWLLNDRSMFRRIRCVSTHVDAMFKAAAANDGTVR